MRAHKCHHIVCGETFCAECGKNFCDWISTAGYWAHWCGTRAILPTNESLDLGSERTYCYRSCRSELNHICGTDTVFGRPVLELAAYIWQASILRAAAFVCQDEAAIAAVVYTVVEWCADRSMGISTASRKCRLEFFGDIRPDWWTAAGLPRPNTEGWCRCYESKEGKVERAHNEGNENFLKGCKVE